MRATSAGSQLLPSRAAPANAAPFYVQLGVAPDAGIVQARVVSRTVARDRRCRAVVTKRRGPLRLTDVTTSAERPIASEWTPLGAILRSRPQFRRSRVAT